MSIQQMNRREALLSGLALSAFPAIARAQEQRKFRNVLLIVADDHGLDMPSYGNDKIRTPNLEALAADSIRFTNAFCTTASCSPSRSVILSGLHNHTNGMFGLQHSYHNFASHNWVEGLPNLLKRNGYLTGLIGKYHVQPNSCYDFDIYHAGKRRNQFLMAQQARSFFKEAQGKPFFLEIGYSDPHRYQKDFGNDLTYEGLPEIRYSPDEVVVPPYLPDTPKVRQDLANYYHAVTRMDHGIGLIMKELKDSGRFDETLIIYISDNGIPFPGAKTTLYDSGMHLPMLVRSPDHHRPGEVNNAMISWVDLVPTILDWTGTEPPKYELQGRSFMPILGEENPVGWDDVYISHQFHEVTMYYPMRGVRTRQFKYINNLFPQLTFPMASDLFLSLSWSSIREINDGTMGVRSVEAFLHHPFEELYDLSKDPNETRNVSDDPQYQEVLKDLRQRTLAFREHTKDPWLIEDYTYRPDDILPPER